MNIELDITEHFRKMESEQLRLDKMYPNRDRRIHKVCCKHCPSEKSRIAGEIDPESKEIKELPKHIVATEYLFVCAWRPSKLCKGLCDYMEIDEQYINEITNNNL